MLKTLLIPTAALFAVACSTVSDRHPRSPAGERFSAQAFVEACQKWDDWDQPAPPFHLFGGSYVVGTCGITAILITSEAGHLVIDSGTEAGADVVAENIEALGYSLDSVRYLSHTQEHFDHVGGMAKLKASTGARLLASHRARPVFESGRSANDDPQHGLHDPMTPVPVDELIADGSTIELGGHSIRVIYTPGHSPGAISWRWRECEAEDCRLLVLSDGLGPVSAPDYRFSDHPDYLADYQRSIQWLHDIEADLCLSVHPSQMRLLERIEAGALFDSTVCRSAAVGVRHRLMQRLTVEQTN